MWENYPRYLSILLSKIYIGWGAGRNEPLQRHLSEAQKMVLRSLKSNMGTGSAVIMIFMY